MRQKKTVCRSASGLFVRNLGWKVTGSGYAQQKFYLGRDESHALRTCLTLESLWEQLSRRWERENRTELHPTDRPVWDEVTLTIADAVRKGEFVARIRVPLPLSAMIPESSLLGCWLDQLQHDITVIKIELTDEDAQKQSEVSIRKEGQRLADLGHRMLNRQRGGENLHPALKAYSEWIESKYLTVDKKLTAWGGTQTRHISFIRRHLADCPLSAVDAQRIEEFIDVLRMRPAGDDGERVSVSWTRNCIKQLRHFLRWLNRTPSFTWQRPADLDLGKVIIPLTPQEQSVPAVDSLQIQSYSPEELGTLWDYASPFQRLLMLLALNCGFGSAEVASLELGEVILRQKHPHEREIGHHGLDDDSWIFRVRRKTNVYGEWKLWPATVTAIDWWLRHRAGLQPAPGVTTLLITRTGKRYDSPTKGNHANFQISNQWLHLATRIRKDIPAFRRLSFNKLRKTAGNFIRQEAGGEVAAVFLCHGTPVKRDELLDLYTNRPFKKVFEAIDAVGAHLESLWQTVANPFPELRARGGPNISLGVIRRIEAMKKQGYKVNYIAEKLGVSPETVRRRTKGGQ